MALASPAVLRLVGPGAFPASQGPSPATSCPSGRDQGPQRRPQKPLSPAACLHSLADASRSSDLVASGQAGTIVASLALLLPALAPTGIRLARRIVVPRKCYKCYGTGFNLCVACNSRGKRGGLVTSLPLSSCRPCEGQGKTRCRSCRGTGLANSWLWEPNPNSTAWGPRGE